MKYIICYDIAEQKLRTKVAKLLEAKAHRQQYSVFVGDFSEKEIRRLRAEMLFITEDSEHTLLFIAPICSSCASKIWMAGDPAEEEQCCIIA